MFNGTKGRLELQVVENSYVSESVGDIHAPANREHEKLPESQVPQIVVQNHFGKAYVIPVEEAQGGHGGGDIRMLRDIFVGGDSVPLRHAASPNRQPVKVDNLVKF